MELQDQQQVVGLRVVEVVMVIHLFKHLPLQPEAEEQAVVQMELPILVVEVVVMIREVQKEMVQVAAELGDY
jgi:Ni/Fe-hydrogenase subunit HybB-like protein